MRPFVVVPTYNERNTLPDLMRALLCTSDVSVVVVDDGVAGWDR